MSAAFGFRAPLVGVLVLLALVAMLGVALSSFSYAAALKLKSEDALAQLLNSVSVPALLLSGILLPMSLAPKWLYNISRANPFSYVVDGSRAAFRGDYGELSLVWGLLSAALLAAGGVWIAAKVFERESA